jgi:putative transposase
MIQPLQDWTKSPEPSSKTQTKTFAFKIKFSNTQLSKVDRYLEISRSIWNYGLGCLVEHEQFVRAYKDHEGKWASAPCSPLPWAYRRIDYDAGWVEGNMAPFCPIVDSRRPYRQCCPIPQPYRVPKLGLTLLSKFTLQYYFAQKNHPSWDALSEIGAWYTRGVCEALSKAWTEYKSGKRGKPRFKSIRDGYTSLSYGDGAKIKIEPIAGKTKNNKPRDASILIPKIGRITVPYLYQDLGDLPIAVLRVVKKPDGWYLQIVCSKVPAIAPKPSTVTIGLCPVGRDGILAVDDQGKEYQISLDEQRLINRREQLQQQAARKRRSLHKLQQSGISVKGTKLAATERKIARISQLLADRRNSQREKIASFMAQRSAAIAIVKPNSALIPHPQPKIRPGTFPAHYDPNGAETVATLNKERSQHGLGEFVALIKQQCNQKDRKVVESPKIAKKDLKKATHQSIAKAIKPVL